jgi:hypothetical protein
MREEKSTICRSFKGYTVKNSSRMRISSPAALGLAELLVVREEGSGPVDEGGS